jgi:hypothetical protein
LPDYSDIKPAAANLVEELVTTAELADYWEPQLDRIILDVVRAVDKYNQLNPNEPALRLSDFYCILSDVGSGKEVSLIHKREGIELTDHCLV